MSEHEVAPEPNKSSFWEKVLVVAQIAGGLAAVGALGIGLVMLGMAL